jgi:hypothetical protein
MRVHARILQAATFGALIYLATSAHAAQFVVTTTADSGAGSLRAAITGADATPGPSTIVFNLAANSTITLASDLPAITASTTINGSGAPGLTLNGNNQFRGLFIGAWAPGTATPVGITVAINNLNFTNTRAQGGAGGSIGGGGGAGLGGAIFVANLASVTVSNVSLTGNNASGGVGGTNLGTVGGGGGGMGGSGGGGVVGGGGGGGGLGSGANGGSLLGGSPGIGIATGAAPGGNGRGNVPGGLAGGGGGGPNGGGNGGFGGGKGGGVTGGGLVGDGGGGLGRVARFSFSRAAASRSQVHSPSTATR